MPRTTRAEDIAARVLSILDARTQHLSAAPAAADDGLVFVIASFAPEMDPVYAAIAAAARGVGLHAERVKDVRGDYRITETILAMIRRARLVVADLLEGGEAVVDKHTGCPAPR